MRELSILHTARLDPEQNTATAETEAGQLLTSPVSPVDDDTISMDKMDHSMQSSVTYWVHNDNQVETELFLLKHLILQLPPLSSQLSSKDIQRSTRTVYLDNSNNWSIYNSIVPESQNQNQADTFKAPPQIIWEENSRNKDVVIVIPDGEGEQRGYTYLPMKRKSFARFFEVKETDQIDLTSAEWGGSIPASAIEKWKSKARKVHNYIQSSSLRPGTSPPLSTINHV